MKLIVGLGNPGKEYEKTRHNVGFKVVDLLASSWEEKFKKEEKFRAEILRRGQNIFAKSQTFMNESGKSVSKLSGFYKVDLEDLIVIHDDLDIRLGEYKVQKGVGPKIHNGINSVEEKLGDKNFWRVRVGIDNRTQEERAKLEGSDYVLGKFQKDEEKILEEVLERIVKELEVKIQ